MSGKFLIIKTTFNTKEQADKIATELLKSGLVSCAQISKIDSMYYWIGKYEHEEEYLLDVKTREDLYDSVESFIKENHPYKLPQIIAVPIIKGSTEYLSWIYETVTREEK